eukprot:2774291-Ditylum_brightwellii.AAC.1
MACCGYTTINQQRLTFLSQQPNSSIFLKASSHTKPPIPEPQTRKLLQRQMRREKSPAALSTHQRVNSSLICLSRASLRITTAGTLKREYNQVAKYSNKTLGSALTNLQSKEKKEVGVRKSCGSQV